MPENKNFVRKHFFINRKLQGHYMLTFLIPMLVMLVFMLLTLYFAAETVVSTTTSSIKQEVQDSRAIKFQDRAETVELYKDLFNDINGYLRNFSSDSTYRRVVLVSLYGYLALVFFWL